MDRIVAACPEGMLEPFFFAKEESNLPDTVYKVFFCILSRYLLTAN